MFVDAGGRDRALARLASQAPEIDGDVLLKAARTGELAPGAHRPRPGCGPRACRRRRRAPPRVRGLTPLSARSLRQQVPLGPALAGGLSRRERARSKRRARRFSKAAASGHRGASRRAEPPGRRSSGSRPRGPRAAPPRGHDPRANAGQLRRGVRQHDVGRTAELRQNPAARPRGPRARPGMRPRSQMSGGSIAARSTPTTRPARRRTRPRPGASPRASSRGRRPDGPGAAAARALELLQLERGAGREALTLGARVERVLPVVGHGNPVGAFAPRLPARSSLRRREWGERRDFFLPPLPPGTYFARGGLIAARTRTTPSFGPAPRRGPAGACGRRPRGRPRRCGP